LIYPLEVMVMSKLKWMIVGARPFALPWVGVNTLLGAVLAGFNVLTWLLAFTIVASILTASHYINSWRDYVLGFDSIGEGSTTKPYTAASQLLPRGLLSTFDVAAGAFALLFLATALMVGYAPRRIDAWALFGLGVFLAITYTDFWKLKGLGEMALFLGHGFGSVTFAYSLFRPVDVTAIVAGIMLGILAAIVYTIDQYQDVETDFGKKAKDLAYIMFKAEIKPSSYIWFSASSVSFLTVAFVLLGWLPIEGMVGLFSLPVFHIAGLVIDYNFAKGTILALVAIWLYPLLVAIAILL